MARGPVVFPGLVFLWSRDAASSFRSLDCLAHVALVALFFTCFLTSCIRRPDARRRAPDPSDFVGRTRQALAWRRAPSIRPRVRRRRALAQTILVRGDAPHCHHRGFSSISSASYCVAKARVRSSTRGRRLTAETFSHRPQTIRSRPLNMLASPPSLASSLRAQGSARRSGRYPRHGVRRQQLMSPDFDPRLGPTGRA